MSKFKKLMALICVAVLLLSAAGCGNKTPDESTGSTDPSQSSPVNGQNINYVVNIRSAGGMPLSGLTVLAYGDEGLTDLKGYGQTDDNGQAVISMPAGGVYYATVTGAPAGYTVESSYKISHTTTDISLTSQVIADTDISNVTYKLGDVMHDFTVTDTDGNEITLSKLLEEKDMVLLNFWFSTCSPCISEFPCMDQVYQKYQDDVAIVALNHSSLSGDTAANIKIFHDSFYDVYDSDADTTGGLSIPMAREDLGMMYAFENFIGGYPTSIVIDRYGVICFCEVGAITSADPFTYIFDAFVGDDYTQKLYHDSSELTPEVKPTEVMPSSDEIAAIISSGQNVTYSAETDPEAAESTWPFIITQKDGVDCIAPSNTGVTGSYATIYMTVELKAGQALGLDYYSSTESGADFLYVLVDRNDVYQISGVGSEWNTCYPWVATEDGTYEIALCYLKDGSEDAGDDTVYIKNVRVVDSSEIDVPSYIPRFAATNMSADGFGYENYITPVYNENDGYYHVGSADGPLLLANLMMATLFSNDPIYTLVVNYDLENSTESEFIVDGVDYYSAIIKYCSYASNSQIYSMCPVTEELKQLLQIITQTLGVEQSENEWLQICEYYDTYGTGSQLTDPTAGLNANSAFKAQLGTNTVTYDRMLMPRGLLYEFVPTQSGAYRITSNSEFEVNGWVFRDEDFEIGEPFYTYEAGERMYYSDTNISMVVYMEAGTPYYVDIAYYDVYQFGTFTFDIEYVAPQYELFVSASPGFFTYYEANAGIISAGGIDVALGDDGYYHELLRDGRLGSIVYADFIAPTGAFPSQSLNDLIDGGAFNFATTEDDQWILTQYAAYEAVNFNGADFENCMRDYWGEEFEANWEAYQVDDVLDGIYHGRGQDLTAIVQKYADMAYGPEAAEKEGCVAVTEELAQALQALMEKFTFRDVDHSWTKLCYYYDYFGPDAGR